MQVEVGPRTGWLEWEPMTGLLEICRFDRMQGCVVKEEDN